MTARPEQIRTRLLGADEAGIREAAAGLAAGRLVAFPTETVYGLGADATSAAAVRSVFAAKGRPSTDPLIVHVAAAGDAGRLGDLGGLHSPARRLVEEFWPGPLTVVVARRPPLADEVGGGRDTVGLRCPAHPVALGLIAAAGVPVAAPSANRFGRVSPTTAAHVLAELDGRIDAVVDGGPTLLGVESTVVSLIGPRPRLLRPGGVTEEDLRAVVPDLETPAVIAALDRAPAESPGTSLAHYAPSVPVVLVEGGPAVAEGIARALRSDGLTVGILRLPEAPDDAARALYDRLRALDEPEADGVPPDVALAAPVDPEGIGRAVNDRLLRASHGHVVTDSSAATIERVRRRLR